MSFWQALEEEQQQQFVPPSFVLGAARLTISPRSAILALFKSKTQIEKVTGTKEGQDEFQRLVCNFNAIPNVISFSELETAFCELEAEQIIVCVSAGIYKRNDFRLMSPSDFPTFEAATTTTTAGEKPKTWAAVVVSAPPPLKKALSNKKAIQTVTAAAAQQTNATASKPKNTFPLTSLTLKARDAIVALFKSQTKIANITDTKDRLRLRTLNSDERVDSFPIAVLKIAFSELVQEKVLVEIKDGVYKLNDSDLPHGHVQAASPRKTACNGVTTTDVKEEKYSLAAMAASAAFADKVASTKPAARTALRA